MPPTAWHRLGPAVQGPPRRHLHGHSACGGLVDAPQTSQQVVVWVSGHGDHLEHRLEGPAVELLLYLVSVEVRGHQAEEVHVHLLQLAHPAHDVWEAGQPVKGARWQARGGQLLCSRGFLPPPGLRPRHRSADSGGRRGAPQSYKSSGPGLGGSCLTPGSGPSSRSPRPAGPPLAQGLPGLAPAHPAQSHAARPGRSQRRDSRLLRGSAVCLGKAEGRGRPLLAASVSGAGTGSSLTPVFAQEGDTRHVTRAIEKQRSGPPSCTDPQADTGGPLGASPPRGPPRSPAQSREHTGSCFLVRVSLSWGLREVSP